jgi:hypothetical protein
MGTGRYAMNARIAGFTGTRDGMTTEQMKSVEAFMCGLWPTTIIHGGCVGADAEFHELAHAMKSDLISIVWPSTVESMRAMLKPKPTRIMPPKLPLDRNRDIVDRCDILIATPKEADEILRSGTWATIRYARMAAVNKQVFIFQPDGELILRGRNSRSSIDDERGYPDTESFGIPGDPE